MLIREMPIKKINSDHLLDETLPALKRKYPITKLRSAHSTFITGDDSPSPGGFAKGVGKPLPETPFT
jgi:hypothetical protein